jgi:spermidine synthase
LLRAGYGESSVGWVYAVNTVGAIAGVILSVHWLMPAIGLKWALLVGAAIDLVLGLVLLRRHLFARAPSLAARLPATTAVAGVAVFVVSAVIFQYDHFKASSGVFRHGVARYSTNVQHLYLRDGKTATVQLQQNDASVRSIRTNGKSDGSIQMDSSKPPASDEPTMTLAGILPLAHAPQSKRAAIIGFGTGMSTATLLAHRGIERVDTIEIEPAMVEAAKHFEPIVTPAYTDPRSRILFDDAKAYFAKSGQKYDIIISEPSNPWVSGISSLFTVEFYRDIKRYLTADGVIAQWIQTYEISEELIASILRALTAEFSSVRVYQTSGGDIIVVASPDRKLAAPVDVWSEYPELSRRLQRVGVRQLSDLDSLYLGSEKVLAALYPLAGVASNSDYFPIVDSGAAKTRFTRASAESLEKLRIAAVPLVEAIDGYSPNRDMKPVESLYGVGALNVSGARRNGQKLVDYILERDDAKAGASPDWDIWAFRRMLNDCSPTDHSKFLRIGAEVAAQVNPQVSADTATSFWARVMASNCAKSIDESERAYLELFKAVGARDGGRIVSLSKTVSQKKTDQFVDEYVSMAGTYGYLLLGDKKSAEDFLKPRWSSLSQARKGSVTFLTLNRLATP